MTDTALDRARRELHEALNSVISLPAREGSARPAYLKAHAAIARLEAAARLAGRVEQLELDEERFDWWIVHKFIRETVYHVSPPGIDMLALELAAACRSKDQLNCLRAELAAAGREGE